MNHDDLLTKSALRAGALMGLSEEAIATVIGVDIETISRMAEGLEHLQTDTVGGRRALMMVKIYVALCSNVGSDDASRRWVLSHNEGLGETPALLMQHEEGMATVLAYLQGIADPQGS